jgi:hypothetical protein
MLTVVRGPTDEATRELDHVPSVASSHGLNRRASAITMSIMTGSVSGSAYSDLREARVPDWLKDYLAHVRLNTQFRGKPKRSQDSTPPME